MSRSYSSSAESGLSIQQIHTAFSDRGFWLAQLAETGSDADLTSFDVDSNGTIEIVLAQEVGGALLPGPFKRLYPGGLTIVQAQSWTPWGGEEIRGEMRAGARGVRGSGVGRFVLARVPDAEQITCSGTLDFKIPFVGGPLEKVFGRQMVDQIPDLLRFVERWIDEDV